MNQEAEKLSGVWEKRETRSGSMFYVNWKEKRQLLQTSDKTGSCGRRFLLTLIDGSEKILEGPWVSGHRLVQETFPDKVVDWK